MLSEAVLAGADCPVLLESALAGAFWAWAFNAGSKTRDAAANESQRVGKLDLDLMILGDSMPFEPGEQWLFRSRDRERFHQQTAGANLPTIKDDFTRDLSRQRSGLKAISRLSAGRAARRRDRGGRI